MYPTTKSMCEFMKEMDRLFPRDRENGSGTILPLVVSESGSAYNIQSDFYHTPNPNKNINSPLHQSTSFNRSSSSADSASSGSFPDIYYRDRLQSINETFDTPLPIRRTRPIVGRKIFNNQNNLPQTLEPTRKFEEELSKAIWQNDEQPLFNTPPKIEQQNTRSVFYELFPTERKGFEFRTPISPQSSESNYGPIACMGSPVWSPNMTNISPNTQKITLPQITSPPVFSNKLDFASSSKYDLRPNKMCTFCRKNGETPLVYMNHTVKERVGNQSIVSCPILRSHVCSTCGATGDNAHTITYCPVLRSNNNGMPLQSTTITLKNTRIKSNGRRRY